jgi:hypothetical protein
VRKIARKTRGSKRFILNQSLQPDTVFYDLSLLQTDAQIFGGGIFTTTVQGVGHHV